MGAACIGEGGSAALRGGQKTEGRKGARAADSGEQGDGLVGTQVKRPCLKTVGDDGQLTGAAREVVAVVVADEDAGGGEVLGDRDLGVMVTEAAQDQQTAALVLANVGQDVLVLHEVGNVGTTGDNGQLLTQGDEAPVVGQDPPPRLLALDIDGPRALEWTTAKASWGSMPPAVSSL